MRNKPNISVIFAKKKNNNIKAAIKKIDEDSIISGKMRRCLQLFKT